AIDIPVLELHDDREQTIEATIREGRRQLGLSAFVNELSGQPLLRKHIFQPTANICDMWSDYTGEGMKTVLPHEARAKIDFRLVPDQDPHELFDLLVANDGSHIAGTRGTRSDSPGTSRRAAARCRGGAPACMRLCA